MSNETFSEAIRILLVKKTTCVSQNFQISFNTKFHNMAKRKRQSAPDGASAPQPEAAKKFKIGGSEKPAKIQATPKAAPKTVTTKKIPKLTSDSTIKAKPKPAESKGAEQKTPAPSDDPITIQIITGSYDRVLHGVTATIHPASSPPSAAPDSPPFAAATFADSFLFNAHTSAVRCLALSPPSAPVPGQGQRVMLATGSTDERVNVYHLSAHPPTARPSPDAELLSRIAARPIRESARNRELGTLLHHASSVTRLAFPTRGKLLSASEDSTVAVTRTRDWSLLSTIKAPVPRVLGRPSGDTAPLGGTPSGVNDFAVHPSLKVMISVSKGERCMRLWNLVTGKKAGVLDFGRELLAEVGEGRRSTGEGRRVVWGGGEEFAVGFDRDVLVFGMDSKVRCKVMLDARTKIHEVAYVPLGAAGDDDDDASVLALSTEDGRVLFFSTATENLVASSAEDAAAAPGAKNTPLPRARQLAQVGGRDAGVTGRVKDFRVVRAEGAPGVLYVVAASSDGTLRVWELARTELETTRSEKAKAAAAENKQSVGRLLGTYETQNRITCVEAFVMIPRPEGVEESEDEADEGDEAEDSEQDSDDE